MEVRSASVVPHYRSSTNKRDHYSDQDVFVYRSTDTGDIEAFDPAGNTTRLLLRDSKLVNKMSFINGIHLKN